MEVPGNHPTRRRLLWIGLPALTAGGWLWWWKRGPAGPLPASDSGEEITMEELAGLAQAYATALMTDSMETLIQELVGQTERYVSPYNIARVYAAHRDPERAFEWLERAYEERNPDLIELQTELVFDSVRGDSRFAGLARRIGFEWHSLSRIKTI
jgi:hypothetical protein